MYYVGKHNIYSIFCFHMDLVVQWFIRDRLGYIYLDFQNSMITICNGTQMYMILCITYMSSTEPLMSVAKLIFIVQYIFSTAYAELRGWTPKRLTQRCVQQLLFNNASNPSSWRNGTLSKNIDSLKFDLTCGDWVSYFFKTLHDICL